MNSFLRSLLLYGLASGAAMALYATVEFAVGLHGRYLSVGQYVGYLRYVILFLGLFLGVKNVRDQQKGGAIGYGKVLQIGFVISLVAGVIITIYEILYNEYINPGFMEDYIQFTIAGMRESGATEAAMEALREQAKAWSTPGAQIAFYLGETLMLGVLFSLILGGIMKWQPRAQSLAGTEKSS
ncbi:MAG: DUF4199 domain-containing protein [Ignavibacteriales bacterium]|nr:DUF4199 domain-containing protein [Ignavibacteriales bacterium]